MNLNEVTKVYKLIRSDKLVCSGAIAVIVLSLLIAIIFSPIAASIISISYILGFIVCAALIRYKRKAGFFLQRLTSYYKEHLTGLKQELIKCNICKNNKCNRHQSSKYNFPHKNVKLDEKLNHAIEDLFDKILETFIISWYSNFTSDETFLNELRVCLRYSSATIISRFLKIDTARLISNKLIPCCIKHIDDFLCMKQIAELKNGKVNDCAVSYLGKRLHAAATNRKNELNYLRNLTECLLPKVLPNSYLNCRNFIVFIREVIAGWVFLPLMDAISDPNHLNSLTILICSYKSKVLSLQANQPKHVEFLHRFIKNHNVKPPSLATDLAAVIKNTDTLYSFMQFLKKEGPVHLLQFCLDIEDFNNKLLTPDLSKKQLDDLHNDALNIFKLFIDPASPDSINCSEEIVSELRKLLNGGVYEVAKLRTSTPLFKAYDHAFGILEAEWLPLFFHSNDFYQYVCGSKVTAEYHKTAGTRSPMQAHGSPVRARNRRYYEATNQGTVAKISSGLGKIKGALKVQAVDGAVYPAEGQCFENENVFEDDIRLSDVALPAIFRDLSAWRVSVVIGDPHALPTGKAVNFYHINIQRIDACSENETRSWSVKRRDQDFYTLKAKLIEFHGENEICDSPLPSRRSTTPLEMRKSKYEEFLQSLLQKPALRGSDLLHTFLTTEQDFTLVATAAISMVGDFGNIYQSVAYKLRKEKGQHLDSFMATFLNSIGNAKPKFEWGDVVEESDVGLSMDTPISHKSRTLIHPVFEDNFGVPYVKKAESSSTSFNPSGITECLFYLLKNVFKLRLSILKLYAAICNIVQQPVESMLRMYIDRKLRSLLSQPTLAYLVNLLQGVIFQRSVQPTQHELEERKKRAFKILEESVPNLVTRIAGGELKTGLCTILDVLQNPQLNKQLAYSLFDIIVLEMYPDLDSKD